MINLIHIVGNRPQFIKLWVLYLELSKNKNINQIIVHSGQHYSTELNDIFFKQLDLPNPDYQLKIKAGISVDEFIGETSAQLQSIFKKYNNTIALVYGDTNTTLAAALAAKRTHTMLHHFEAGVRTSDTSMPEEINRVLTDRLADVNYCCTQKNYDTLIAEGYTKAIGSKAFITGDLMLDAYKKASYLHIPKQFDGKYIAATIHRVDNILQIENLVQITEALNTIHQLIPVKLPLHPHTRKKMEEFGISAKFDILNPMDYFSMHQFINHAEIVITDSGGVSREAFFAHKKSIIIMPDPFWSEIIDAGCGIKSIAEKDTILKHFNAINNLSSHFDTPIFGNGNAAQAIHQIINSLI
ncbi:MAG: hypothetical protein E6Q95_04770 [Chitinophagaceae bacterium]|nr:MAG: hypothetical protein E6Q95_04770 [Chitinophagaceae bacterium]